MATSVQGSDVSFQVRVADTGTFKTMVCEDTLSFDITNEISSAKTKTCGTFKGVSAAEFKANGSAVFNAVPSGSEVSYDDVSSWQIAKTKVEFIILNTNSTVGDLIRMSAYGYFTSSQFTANDGDVCKFTWALEGDGTLNDTESA